jgi:RNA polymerase sigma factor (TIGR02999 family)
VQLLGYIPHIREAQTVCRDRFVVRLEVGPQNAMTEVATILGRTVDGKEHGAQSLLPLVYEELRKLAAARMANEWNTSTLQPTALVHEAWLRLAESDQQAWKNRAHFFAAAAEAMRRILIDHARRKRALKRGAGCGKVDLDRVDIAVESDDETLLLISEALEKLSQQDAQCAELVKLRFFVGMDYQEAADAMGISERTAKRCWTFARAWLYRELQRSLAARDLNGHSEEHDGPLHNL